MEQEEKKLPEGLEEAAERWAEKHPFNGRVSSFKAGAEWRDAQIPKLPDGVEEAAEEYYEKYESGLSLSDFDDYGCPTIQPFEIDNAFMAGAEWGRAKMMEGAVEGVAEELYNDGEPQCTVGVGTYFKPGEEVYVIKKEDEK